MRRSLKILSATILLLSLSSFAGYFYLSSTAERRIAYAVVVEISGWMVLWTQPAGVAIAHGNAILFNVRLGLLGILLLLPPFVIAVVLLSSKRETARGFDLVER